MQGHCGQKPVRFQDVKPYGIPSSLDDLHGPSSGRLSLPKSIFWAPGGGEIDLSTEGGIKLAYQAVISEGKPDEQCRLLNKQVLLAVWPRLSIPAKAARLWQTRFPELRGNMRAELIA